MKKYLSILTIITFITLALLPALAAAQAPPPPNGASDDQSDPYAPQSSQQSADPNAQTQPDANAPGVARISYLKGDVSTQRGDTGDWVALTQNSPVSQGDKVATGQSGRAEVQLDYANILRLSNNATANITNLSRGSVQVQIGQGLVTYSLLKGGEAAPEIDTPNTAIRPSGQGDYRIQVNSDSETVITVRRGSADVSTPDGSTHIEQGQSITVEGTDSPQYRTDAAMARDEWDSFNDDRDHRIAGASSWGHTNRYYTGSEDLDQHGTWTEIPDYGQVWTPSETSPDWAPYRDGRWVYEPYYGWTWVSYEPWGWAPYHYGRWFVYNSNWVWWPGPVGVYPGYYPVWSPAYVSFFGFGGGAGFGVGFGVGFGFGHFGWLPCGPGDWYHPWFGRWGGRVNNVNITNINNFHNGFAPLGGNRVHQFSNFNGALHNDRIRNGISSQAGNEFGRSGVSRNQQHLSAASFRSGQMMGGKMPVTPSHESFSPSGRNAGSSSMRAGNGSSRRFYNSGGHFNGPNNSSVVHSSGGANARSFGNNNGGNFNQGSRGGESGFGGNRNNSSNSSSSVQSNRGGWQKFSPPSNSNGRSGSGFGADNRSTSNNSGRGSFGSSGSASGNESANRGGWQHYSPNTSSRSGSSNSSNSYSRPSLNMRQPIVTPRGGSNSNNSRGSGSSGTSTYGPFGSRGNSNESRGGTYGNQNQNRGGGFNNNENRGSTYGGNNGSTGNSNRGGFNNENRSGSFGGSRGGNSGGSSTPHYSAPHSNGGGSNSGGHSSGGGHSGGGGHGGHH